MFVPSVWLTAPRNSTSSNAGNVGFVTYVRELAVEARLAGAEAILVGQADHELVHERHAEARHLHPRTAIHFRTRERRQRIQQAGLAQRSAGPAADDAVAAAREAALVQLERDAS